MNTFLDLVACEFFSNQQSAAFDRLNNSQLEKTFNSLKELYPSYLFSEFNLFYGTERRKALAQSPSDYLKWFDLRINLFQRICLPAFDNLLVKPNKWFLLCDVPQSDEEKSLMNKLINLSQSYTIAFANFRDSPSDLHRHYTLKPNLIKDCISHTLNHTENSAIITSRVDTDDALGHQYFYNIYKFIFLSTANQAFQSDKFILNFPVGSQVVIDDQYAVPQIEAKSLIFGENCFISKIEYQKDIKLLETVWNLPHDQVFGSAPVYNLVTQSPAWYQLIHGRNIQNSALESPFIVNKKHLPSFLV